MSEPFTNHMGNSIKGRTILKPGMTKREFLKFCGVSFCALSAAQLFGPPKPVRAKMPQKSLIKTKLFPYFPSPGGGDIQCELCPKQCRVRRGERGACRVRENRDGKCYSLVYANPCAFHPDPVEKNPFFHVLPGTWSLSLATAGCNFTCKFCQTWEISQASPEDVFSYEILPELVVKRAKQMRTRSVSYTYVEPIIFYEYMVEVGFLAKKAGLLSLIHSNGFINPDPLRNLSKVIDGANIDLKAFTDEFYRELCGG